MSMNYDSRVINQNGIHYTLPLAHDCLLQKSPRKYYELWLNNDDIRLFWKEITNYYVTVDCGVDREPSEKGDMKVNASRVLFAKKVK